MKPILVTIAMFLAVAVFVVTVMVSIDYVKHIMYASEMRRIDQRYKDQEREDLLKICENYRAFQETPAGKGNTSMDPICNDIERKVR